MVLWRISNYADLTGAGGMVTSARWHTAGRPVVYLADSPASALLEILLHLEVDEAHRPGTYRLLKVEADDSLTNDQIDPASLPAAWATNEAETQSRGHAWLRTGATALLRVPSTIVPETFSWLLNPRHPDAIRVRIVQVREDPWDTRLL